jgi:pyruvate,water dikinase
VSLDDPRARDAWLTGAKGAALARARGDGLPVLPGFVVTTTATARLPLDGHLPARDEHPIRAAWSLLSAGGARPLVVRSSSTAEDSDESSMAGLFESVLDVRGWDGFVAAVRRVVASREGAARASASVSALQPLAVLVQPMLVAAGGSGPVGGVMFGVEPASGREDRVVVDATVLGPAALVSGRATPTRYELDPAGALVARHAGRDGADLDPRTLRALHGLARQVARLFGGPQDVEWAIADDGLVLLQSRPVTTALAGVPVGPVFGPGPVVETFPDPVSTLEEDLWVVPLRDAMREALLLAGTSEHELRGVELVVVTGGRVAVNLDVVGETSRRGRSRRGGGPGRRLRAARGAWAIGRLRSSLPTLAEDLVARVDRSLLAVPALDDLSDRQLLSVIDRGRRGLVSVHAHEILVGQLVHPAAAHLTAASAALRVLAHARRTGVPEERIAVLFPIVLSLAPPRVGPAPRLPRDLDLPPWSPPETSEPAAIAREALRLRARWLQELTGRAAWALGVRLHTRGVLAEPAAVRALSLEALQRASVHPAVPPAPVEGRAVRIEPLPARFRLSDKGAVLPVEAPDGAGGTGAGGGRGTGPVRHDPVDLPPGAVLVVALLDPSLARHLPGLAGLVAETGSALSHLAILARESGVPTVVGVADARRRFPEGALVTVDGTTGAVVVERAPAPVPVRG